ncbi:MAG: histone deacetylase [Thermodesulfobacteriota bacterium]
MTQKTAIVKDEIYLQHLTGDSHPENHHRLEVVYEMLQEEEMQGKFRELPPRPATREELELNHSLNYVDQVASTAGRSFTSLDPDTTTSPRSWDAAQKAAGGVLVAIDKVMEGEVDNAFALVRPPGHHAEKSRGMGFCLFNNIAIGAHYARQKYSLDRILAIDWDLHHGNGTQNAFYEDPHVVYFSTHQYPYYPGSGGVDEVGKGEGTGFTINVPLPGGQGDQDFAAIYRGILNPVALEFKPQLILLSAGYDIYFQDPLGGMDVTPEGFAMLTSTIMDMAQSSCQGKLVVTLEGGYHLGGLRDSVKATLKELMGDSILKDAKKEGKLLGSTEEIMEKVRKRHKDFWSSL